MVGDGLRRAIDAARLATVAERSNAGIDGMIQCHGNGCDHTAHAEERPQFRMDDGTMPAQFTEARFQADGDVQ